MKKDDVIKNLKEAASLVESNELTHTQVKHLWSSSNCIKQHVEYMIKTNTNRNQTPSDNEQD